MSLKDAVLTASKAHDIPASADGRWSIKKFETARPLSVLKHGIPYVLPAGRYTQLYCWTLVEIQKALDGDPAAFGECVMEDSPSELNTHLEFMLKAHGDVLITGLGLGCVVRGTLANPAVKQVTVIERDRSILRIVKPHMPKTDRLEIIKADAREWVRHTRRTFDCAWHDLWSDPDKQEIHLQRTHLNLIVALRKRVRMQGAWAFPRMFRRRMQTEGVL